MVWSVVGFLVGGCRVWGGGGVECSKKVLGEWVAVREGCRVRRANREEGRREKEQRYPNSAGDI